MFHPSTLIVLLKVVIYLCLKAIRSLAENNRLTLRRSGQTRSCQTPLSGAFKRLGGGGKIETNGHLWHSKVMTGAHM